MTRACRNVLLITIAAALAAFTSGCSKEEPPPPVRESEMPAEQGPEPADIPEPRQQEKPGPEKLHVDPRKGIQNLRGGYLPTVVDAYTKSKIKLPLIQVTSFVQSFRTMEGRYPNSLEELQKWQGGPLPKLPAGTAFTYDAKTGEVGVVRLPRDR